MLGPPIRQMKPSHKEELVHILTRKIRLLPDFLIVGTQKGGTTSLFTWLTRHPNDQETRRLWDQYSTTHTLPPNFPD